MYALANQQIFSEQDIQNRIKYLAGEIIAAYGTIHSIRLVGLLRGCILIVADLMRELSRQGMAISDLDFMIVSSYGSGMKSSNNVKIERDIRSDIEGEHILIVDDILDTGNTLDAVFELLSKRNPASIKSCVLLDKPSRRQKKLEADFVGFQIDNQFVVGYGLDFDQRYRELPYIGILEERA